MKISKVIFSLCIIFLILGLVSILFPRSGVNIGSIHLIFPPLDEIFFDKKPQYADITSIVVEQNISDEQEKKIKRVKIKADNIVNIEFPNEESTYLDSFFSSLNKIATDNNVVRVIHYGDSQIEGDRITSYLRARLQGMFGGDGRGEIPLYSRSNIKNITFSYSDSCQFYSIIHNKRTLFRNYGLMQSVVVCVKDTSFITIHFDKKTVANMTLYCKSNSPMSHINILNGESILTTLHINNSEGLSAQKINNNTIVKSLTFQIIGNVDLYSLDFSDTKGIYVDNVPLRGCSGNGFTKNNPEFLASMSKKLNVKLLILQFGVNAVPQDEQQVVPSYNYYKVQLRKEINFLKKSNPDAAIIIVSVSDRSRKKGTHYETNPNIPKILSIQKQVAKECGVAFWNLYEAMGGKNSMPSWVLRERPLANPDFIHFNNIGAKYVGEMFYKALENAYYDYQER